MPLLRSLPGAHHDGHGGGQTQGAGAGNDQHGHARGEGVGDVLPVANHQATAVTAAMTMTMGTKTPATLSASLAMGALEEEASSTSRIIWARVVSSPTRLASKMK